MTRLPWPRTEIVRDVHDAEVVAVLRTVVCTVEARVPDTRAGPGVQAIPPEWFQQGCATAVLGAVRLRLPPWSAEPATLSVRVALGQVTVEVPEDWVVELEARNLGGHVVDERPEPPPGADGVVHLRVTGTVAAGRVRVVGLPDEER